MHQRAAELPPMQRCRLSPTLAGYVAWRFSVRFAVMLGGLVAVIGLVTIVEMLDQVANKTHASFLVGIEMALLKLPDLAQEILPFAVLFAAMALFWGMTRASELVVVRAAGVSMWQIQAPIVVVALAIGALTVTAVNPLGAVLLKRQERMAAEYTSHRPAVSSVDEHGLWLRDVDDGDVAVIHARQVRAQGRELRGVTIYRYDGRSRFHSRIDAARAHLRGGTWVLHDARTARPGEATRTAARRELKTSLTPREIYNSFAPPETISFWALPGFIAQLQRAGFAAEPQKLRYHRLLSMPVLLAAMTLLAAVFSLRSHRRGGAAALILAGVLTGVLLHVLSNLIFAIGLSSHLPVALAAWTPAGIALMLGIYGLMSLEDG
jgi:lipopolysaccharide export system permease protein